MAENVLAVKQSLTIEEAIKFLESPDQEKVIFSPPQRPKAGQIYLFSCECNSEKRSKLHKTSS